MRAASSLAAVSSSLPSAIIVIFVSLAMPRERTPKRLFALALLSPFSTQTELLNVLAL